jgi:hypothetical protein
MTTARDAAARLRELEAQHQIPRIEYSETNATFKKGGGEFNATLEMMPHS